MRRDRLKKLAGDINALARKDEQLVRKTRDIADIRIRAAMQLYGMFAEFIQEINQLLPDNPLMLDPETFTPPTFKDSGTNLFQINVRGRILQAGFEATDELLSTEDFRVPYTLHGAVRCFNQTMLDLDLIEEQLLYYCVENGGGNAWRFFDPRTYRTGVVDQDYLLSLMEHLV